MAEVGETVSTKEYFEALRKADQRALEIADTARAEAIALARDIQTYKDAQHNDILNQWAQSRATYATQEQLQAQWEKYQAAHQPVLDYINSQRGGGRWLNQAWVILLGSVGCATGIGAFLISLAGIVLFILHLGNPTLP